MMEQFEHRHEVVVRRTEFDLGKAEERAHILEGYKIALDNIDAVIALIKKSKDTPTAREGLMTRIQTLRDTGQRHSRDAPATADRSGAAEDRGGISGDHQADRGTQRDSGLRNPPDGRSSRTELLELKRKYGDERRTEILDDAEDFTVEDLDRRRGHGDHHLPRRVYQAAVGLDVSPAEPRRARRDRDGNQGRGFRRASLYRLDARVYPVFHQQGTMLLAEGA